MVASFRTVGTSPRCEMYKDCRYKRLRLRTPGTSNMPITEILASDIKFKFTHDTPGADHTAACRAGPSDPMYMKKSSTCLSTGANEPTQCSTACRGDPRGRCSWSTPRPRAPSVFAKVAFGRFGPGACPRSAKARSKGCNPYCLVFCTNPTRSNGNHV